MGKHRKLNPQRLARDMAVCQDYQNGIIGKFLEEKWNLPRGTANSILRRNGVQRQSSMAALRENHDRQRLPEAEVDRIVELHGLGLINTDIQRLVHHDVSTVNRWLRQRGLTPNIGYRLKTVLNPEDIDAIYKLRVDHNMHTSDALQKLGYHGSVSKSLPDWVRGKMPSPGKAQKIAAIVADYVAGLPTTEIAAKHRISLSTMNKYVGEAGIPRRHQGVRPKPPVCAE